MTTTASNARRGLDALLAHFPDRDIKTLDSQPERPVLATTIETGEVTEITRLPPGPWMCVTFDNDEEYAIWKATGNIYRVGDDGAVDEDPFLKLITNVTREHVEQAVAELKARGLLSDTSPGPDGRRSAEKWLNAVREDAALIQSQLESTLREGYDRRVCLAVALKEARRMQSDIYRFGDEVHGVSHEEIDKQGPL